MLRSNDGLAADRGAAAAVAAAAADADIEVADESFFATSASIADCVGDCVRATTGDGGIAVGRDDDDDDELLLFDRSLDLGVASLLVATTALTTSAELSLRLRRNESLPDDDDIDGDAGPSSSGRAVGRDVDSTDAQNNKHNNKNNNNNNRSSSIT